MPSPIIMHPDQTTKQPLVWVCLNPDCKPSKFSMDFFEFAGDYPKCPKCEAEGHPTVQKKVLIHLLVPDKRGPIKGEHRRFRMACDKTREHLATLTNGEAASDHIETVNCPGCLAELTSGRLNDVLGPTASRIPKSFGEAIRAPEADAIKK